jgi:hypothetical protein
LLSVLLLFAAILTLLCYEFFPAKIAQTSPDAFDIRSWPQIALLSLALTFPVALISGTIFPLIAARFRNPAAGNNAGPGGRSAGPARF